MAEATGTNSFGWPSSNEEIQAVKNQDEMPAETSEPKRKRFSALHVVRRIFRRKSKPPLKDDHQKSSTLKSQSTGELSYLVSVRPGDRHTTNQSSTRKKDNMSTTPYNGLSVSHDSVFAPELDNVPSATSPSKVPKQPGFPANFIGLQEELANKFKSRHVDSDDDDAGLPRSPPTSPTTAEVLHQGLMKKSVPLCSSDGSLLSVGSSETDNDEGTNSGKLLFDNAGGDPDLDIGSTVLLNCRAARHKIAVKPRRTRALPLQRQAAAATLTLPATPEDNEESISGIGIAEKASSKPSSSVKIPQTNGTSRSPPVHKTSPLNSPPPIIPRFQSPREAEKVFTKDDWIAEVGNDAETTVKHHVIDRKHRNEIKTFTQEKRLENFIDEGTSVKSSDHSVKKPEIIEPEEEETALSCFGFSFSSKKEAPENSTLADTTVERGSSKDDKREDPHEYGFTDDTTIKRTKAVASMQLKNVETVSIPSPDYGPSLSDNPFKEKSFNNLNLNVSDTSKRKENTHVSRSSSINVLREKTINLPGKMEVLQIEKPMKSPEIDYNVVDKPVVRKPSVGSTLPFTKLETLKSDSYFNQSWNVGPVDLPAAKERSKPSVVKREVSPPKEIEIKVEEKSLIRNNSDSRRRPLDQQLSTEDINELESSGKSLPTSPGNFGEISPVSPPNVTVQSAKDVVLKKINQRPVSLPPERISSSYNHAYADSINSQQSNTSWAKSQQSAGGGRPTNVNLSSRKSSYSSVDAVADTFSSGAITIQGFPQNEHIQSNVASVETRPSDFFRRFSTETEPNIILKSSPPPVDVIREVIPIISDTSPIAVQTTEKNLTKSASVEETQHGEIATKPEEPPGTTIFGVALRRSVKYKRNDSSHLVAPEAEPEKVGISVTLKPVPAQVPLAQDDSSEKTMAFGRHILRRRPISESLDANISVLPDTEPPKAEKVTSLKDTAITSPAVVTPPTEQSELNNNGSSAKELKPIVFRTPSQFQRRALSKNDPTVRSSLIIDKSTNNNVEIVEVSRKESVASDSSSSSRTSAGQNQEVERQISTEEFTLKKIISDDAPNSKVGNCFIGSRRTSVKSASVEEYVNKNVEKERESLPKVPTQPGANHELEVRKPAESPLITARGLINRKVNYPSEMSNPKIDDRRKSSINNNILIESISVEKKDHKIDGKENKDAPIAPDVRRTQTSTVQPVQQEPESKKVNEVTVEAGKIGKTFLNETNNLKTGTSFSKNMLKRPSMNAKVNPVDQNVNLVGKSTEKDKGELTIVISADTKESQVSSKTATRGKESPTHINSPVNDGNNTGLSAPSKISNGELNSNSTSGTKPNEQRAEPNDRETVGVQVSNNNMATPDWKKRLLLNKQQKELQQQQEKDAALKKSETTFIIEADIKPPINTNKRASKVLTMVNNFQNQDCA